MHKILIADDNISLLEILTLSLKDLGYEVRSVSSKADLTWTLRTFTPDLIILDVFLDKMDGREICKKLREDHKMKTIPIIIFSSNPYAISEFKKFGADDCIEKPFALPVLLDKIREKLDKRIHSA